MKIVFVTREGYNLPGARIRWDNLFRELPRRGIDRKGILFRSVGHKIYEAVFKIIKNIYISVFILIIVLFSSIIGRFLLTSVKNASAKKNIIIITIDALRPDHLGCYGYNRNTSPNIDKLSRKGIKFTHAIAPGGWTLESVSSILSGTDSFVRKIYNALPDLINPNAKTLAQELLAKQYQTILFSNHGPMECFEIQNGFQKKWFYSITEDGKPVISDSLLTEKIGIWLKENDKSAPFFMYIHYHGCHVPYRPPIPYKNMYMQDKYRKRPQILPISTDSSGQGIYNSNKKIPYIVAENNITDFNYYIGQYDGVVSYMDDQIGRLMKDLEDLGLDRNTLLILIADHGEMLGEHKIYFNHVGGFEENIRVPLIISLPKVLPKGKVVSKQVSLIDIAPTILEILGIAKPSYMQGESLLAFIKPFRAYRAKYAFSSYFGSFTVRTEEWKFIYNNKIPHQYELYNLKNDPKEQYNVADKRLDIIKQLDKRIEEWKKGESLGDLFKSISEKDKDILRSFGYIQ